MNGAPFSIALLGRQDRSDFRSGVEPLDRYFQSQVSQDVRRRVATCFVIVDNTHNKIAGYYTLSAADIPLPDIPADMSKRLPRYPTVPAARIGRLAVDQRYRGLKLGSVLLYDAAKRAAASEIGVFAIIVDAKDDAAAAFYRYHGFEQYGSAPTTLIAPLRQLLA